MFRERIFVIGGGPSLQNFDFNLLKDEKTMAVNYAVQHVPNPTYFVTADSGVIQRAVENNFWGLEETTKVVIMGREHPRYRNVKHFLKHYDVQLAPYRTDTGFLGFDYSHFVTGKNTGFCAFQYAVLLRFKEIYLLGFDMGRGENKRKYFYTEGRGTSSPFDMFLGHFIQGIKRLKSERRDQKVFLGSKPSKLEPYLEYVDVEGLLK